MYQQENPLNASSTGLGTTEVFLLPQGLEDSGRRRRRIRGRTLLYTSIHDHPQESMYKETGLNGPCHQVVDAQPESNSDSTVRRITKQGKSSYTESSHGSAHILSGNLEFWNLESGIWNLEFGIWNLESGSVVYLEKMKKQGYAHHLCHH